MARDFAIGRVYLPEEDRRRFGYTDADLAAGRSIRPFAELMRFEVERTRDLFYRGLPLVDLVPAEVRVDVDLFARGGLAFGQDRAADYNVWHRRPRSPSGRKRHCSARPRCGGAGPASGRREE